MRSPAFNPLSPRFHLSTIRRKTWKPQPADALAWRDWLSEQTDRRRQALKAAARSARTGSHNRAIFRYAPPMHAPRALMSVLAVGLIATGCSGSDSASSASQAPPTSSSPSPSPSPTSAFCLDLSTFQVGVVAYRGDVGRLIQGEQGDLKELRRKAKLTLRIGEKMKSSAPPDIADQFRTVLKALKTSSSNLKAGSKVTEVADPVYGKKNRPAFEAVSGYECES